MNERILITGGCGFVGANIAIELKKNYPNIEIIVLDNLKRRGAELNIPRLKEMDIAFVHGDIRNKEDFDSIGEITTLLEAAAEPSVLSGINSTPDYVLNANLVGAINCLNFALKHKAKFIFLSTSRVYPISQLNNIDYLENTTRFDIKSVQNIAGVSEKGINEDFSLNGARSFYGTSKLSAELIIQEYMEFYGLEAVINRCGVITGAWQMGKIDQGVVVLWLAKHYWQKELSYIGFGGEGKQVRDIMHIQDLYELVKMQILDIKQFKNDIYNVGGGLESSVSLQELTKLCQEITGNIIPIHQTKENRQADIPVYITDNTKITELTGWKPQFAPKEILLDIFKWIKENEKIVKMFLN